MSPVLDETLHHIYTEIIEKITLNNVNVFKFEFEYRPWVFSVLGSIAISLMGVLPLLILPVDSGGNEFSDPAESKSLKIILSFAVGCLLGDVFLNSLPKVWSCDRIKMTGDSHPGMSGALWVLCGILLFTIIEKIFSSCANADQNDGKTSETNDAQHGAVDSRKSGSQPIKIAGYLNLMANSIDNFTQGLAVAASFLVSFRQGLLGTIAILLHGIPHEVGDFAILLRSGFNRWDAAKAQLLTSGTGLIGALLTVGGTNLTTVIEARTSWIMPFTAGGFLHISLCTILPDLLKETDTRESIKQMIALLAGVATMAAMTIVLDA